jgi:hypothetical protein
VTTWEKSVDDIFLVHSEVLKRAVSFLLKIFLVHCPYMSDRGTSPTPFHPNSYGFWNIKIYIQQFKHPRNLYLKMEAVCSSETPLTLLTSTQYEQPITEVRLTERENV